MRDRNDKPTVPAALPAAERTPAEAALVTAGKAAGWLAKTGWRVTRSLPGGHTAERQLLKLERAVVGELRRRLEPTGTTPGFAWRGPTPLTAGTHRAQVGEHELVALIRPMNGQVEPLRAGMAELLNRSVTTDIEASREYLFATILRQLVPDEARILAAFADGAARPVVHVAARNPLGGTGRLVLENASTVGRDAGVTVPEYVPFYLGRLYRFGLVDILDEDPDLAEQYDLLLTDELVRAAEREARRGRRGGARIIRRAALMSVLGKRFWAACDPLS